MDSTAEKNIGAYDAQGIYSDPFGYDFIGSTYKVIPRVLTLGTVAAQSKTYDGNTSADASKFHAALVGVVSGDENLVSATATGAAYNSKDVRAANVVNYTGIVLTGTGAENYRIASTVQGAGTIAPRALTFDSVAAQTKTYDGNTNADAAQFHATLGNVVAGEENSVSATATGAAYNSKDVRAAHTVSYTGVALGGTGAGNYTLASTAQGTGTITHRDLTLTADAKSIVQDGSLPVFTGQASGFAEGEDASVFGADGITFGTTVTNTDRPSRYDIIGRVGGVSDGVVGNYRIGQAAGNARAFTVYAAVPGGILTSLVQDAAPRFDMGFGQEVYVFGFPRPIPTATLGIYRFRAARDFNIEGLRLD